MSIFPDVNTTLDLNGPELSFTSNPSDVSVTVESGTATFTATAIATFPPSQTSRNTNTGSIAYRWYKNNIALSDGGGVSGSETTTLTLSGLTSPNDDGSTVFLRADYVPSAYESGLTANANNEPVDSSLARITVFPTITITSEPQDTGVVEDVDTTFTVNVNTTDGSESSLSYQWYLNGVALFDSSLVSGSQTPTLTIKREEPSLSRVYCEITHPTAQPSTVTSRSAKLDVFSARALINYEKLGNGELYETGSRDIGAGGGLIFPAVAERGGRIIVLWSSEKDVDVKITMAGSAGEDRNGNSGGQGGLSVFKLTMKKDFEYVVKLGVSDNTGGGARGGRNGGGGLASIYEKAKVVAVCGGGGGAGVSGAGGDGGGCNVAGEDGQGTNAGIGGHYIGVGELPPWGETQAGRTGIYEWDGGSPGGGRLAGCTIGNYWNQQGVAPCDDVSTDKIEFYKGDGGIYSNTKLFRGYKIGQGFRNNGGGGSGNGGGGGSGARGGAGTDSNAGGGGASGYQSGQIELLSSSVLPRGTQLGGNPSTLSFISVERYIATDDQVPLRPDNTGTQRVVTFTVTRESDDENTITFERSSGDGPSQLIFGPNGNNVTAQITRGAVYERTSTTDSGGRGVSIRLTGSTLELDDNSGDDDFDDLTITPDNGTFTSDSRYEANW